jgi:hypothetical protein
VAALPIPTPPATAEGEAGRGSFLAELGGGLRFVLQRRPLLGLVLYLTFINFLLNGPLELAIPYFIALTGSEAQMGVGLGLMSLGALAGGALVAVIGGYRPRLRLLLAGSLLNGLMFLVFGTARSLPLLGLSIFLLMVPLPANNALFRSILQVKTPPDLQGRVFAVEQQLALLGSTTSFLLTGPLVDRWLQPAIASPGWGWLAPWLGQGPGAAIGLVLVATGVLILAATLAALSWPALRRLEADLPDYGT